MTVDRESSKQGLQNMSLCEVVDEVMDSRFPADDSKLVFFVACELWVHSHIREDLEISQKNSEQE